LDQKFPVHNKKFYVIVFLIALLTVLVYLPALDNDFVNWDDPYYIEENLHIRSLDVQFLKWMFSTFHMQNWHPLTWLSHAIDYALWGLSPMGHHLTSIMFHALNTVLVVILIMRLFNEQHVHQSVSQSPNEYGKASLFTALVTGILFALHPLHVESVAWISERKDIICAFFFLLSMLSYVNYAGAVQKKTALHYIFSLLFYILALMSKPMAVTLPIVLLILDFYPLERLSVRSAFTRRRKVLIEKIPFLVLSCAMTAIVVLAQKKEIASFDVTLWERIAVACKSLAFYLFKIVWPTNLAPLYPYPSNVSLFSFPYNASVLLVACITAFCIWSWKREKVFLVVWFSYIIMLLPVLGIIKVGQQAAADRYMYLPSIGPLLLIGLAVSRLWEHVTFNRKRLVLAKVLAITIIIGIASIFLILTVDQIKVWKNSVTLWSREIQFYDIPTARNNRGNAYITLGRYQQAINDYDAAIRIDPRFAKAYVNRGVALTYIHEYKKALHDFNTALDLDIQDSSVYFNRGNVFKALGFYERALEDYTKALSLNPENVDAYNNRGTTYLKLIKLEMAIEDFTNAITLDPENEMAHANRGLAYEKQGAYERAVKDYQISAQLGNKQAQEYLRSKGMGW
jgi:tetratricopeptide (TPR) repeat protein